MSEDFKSSTATYTHILNVTFDRIHFAYHSGSPEAMESAIKFAWAVLEGLGFQSRMTVDEFISYHIEKWMHRYWSVGTRTKERAAMISGMEEALREILTTLLTVARKSGILPLAEVPVET